MTPHLLHQLPTTEHLPGMLGQEHEETELRGGEIDAFLANKGRVAA
jgi:hypothetical protein